MGKITDIKPQIKSKGRVSVYIDDKFYCGLEKLTAALHRLKIGDEVDEDKLKEAVYDSECAAAFEKSAKYLGLRPRTENEIKTYLSGKGYSYDVINATVSKLCDYGYINDAEYCRVYVREYCIKQGARKIEADLRALGVEQRFIDEAISEMEDQTENVTRLAEKYLRSHAPDKRKLITFLLSKGFDYDTVKESVENINEVQ